MQVSLQNHTTDTTTAMTKEIQGSKLSGVGSPRTQTASLRKDHWPSEPERKRTRTHTIASELIVKNQKRILKWRCHIIKKALRWRLKIKLSIIWYFVEESHLAGRPLVTPCRSITAGRIPKNMRKSHPIKVIEIWYFKLNIQGRRKMK